MDAFSLLKSILADLEKYDSEQPGRGVLTDFYTWAIQQKKVLSKDEVAREFQKNIGRLVVNMYRYSRHYIRKKLNQDSQINFEDFIFLANLDSAKAPTKSELIQICVQEKTTGMAVINRLIALKMIDSARDEKDKRKIVIRLTEKGRHLIHSYFSQMQDIVSIIGGRLSDDEKMHLLKLLHKLDNFHFDIFTNDHDTSIEEVKEKYLG